MKFSKWHIAPAEEADIRRLGEAGYPQLVSQVLAARGISTAEEAAAFLEREYDASSCKEYKKLLELICRNEEKLKATMTDDQKELFDKYADCVREYQTITDCLIF